MASASGHIGGVPNVGRFSSPPYEACMFAKAIAVKLNMTRERWKNRYLAIFEFQMQMK